MADYHTVYKGLEGETTKWDDIQRKLGNLAPLPPLEKPEKFAPEAEVTKDKDYLDCRDQNDLEDLEDEFADDRELEKYRQKRVKEMKEAINRPRYGTLEMIRAPEFAQKVTSASMDVWVVVLLIKDEHEESKILTGCLEVLAGRFHNNKFVKMIGTDCIVNYPDANCPTCLLYRDGKCQKSIMGLTVFGGKRASYEQVALVLNQVGPICRKPGQEEGDHDEPDMQEMKGLVKRIVLQRQQAADEADEDSDFSD